MVVSTTMSFAYQPHSSFSALLSGRCLKPRYSGLRRRSFTLPSTVIHGFESYSVTSSPGSNWCFWQNSASKLSCAGVPFSRPQPDSRLSRMRRSSAWSEYTLPLVRSIAWVILVLLRTPSRFGLRPRSLPRAPGLLKSHQLSHVRGPAQRARLAQSVSRPTADDWSTNTVCCCALAPRGDALDVPL